MRVTDGHLPVAFGHGDLNLQHVGAGDRQCGVPIGPTPVAVGFRVVPSVREPAIDEGKRLAIEGEAGYGDAEPAVVGIGVIHLRWHGAAGL